MLEIEHRLPAGVLLDAPSDALQTALSNEVLWWDATGFQTDATTGAIEAWRPRLGLRTGFPTDPNTGHGQIGEAGDLIGLQARVGVHCGMVMEDVTPEAATTSLAIRYLPPFDGPSRTVLTLNTGGMGHKAEGENYLFLSETDGVLTAKDDAGRVKMDLAAPPAQFPRTVVIAVQHDRLTVEILGGARSTAQASAPILSGPANLFVACRNQRSGLLKTLGGALITDLWLWPGQDLLAGDTPGDLLALRRFNLWAEDS